MNTYVCTEIYYIEDYYPCKRVFSFTSPRTKEEIESFLNSSFEEFKKRKSEYLKKCEEYSKNPEIVEYEKQRGFKNNQISKKRSILDKKYCMVPKKERTLEYNQEIDKIKQEIDDLNKELYSIKQPQVLYPVLDNEFVLDHLIVKFSDRFKEVKFKIMTLEDWLGESHHIKIEF